ncbi:bifunctional hydroxymethylpyrimidine kinase/phosphomethylpyrimidine kinase [Mergibacter septicus]|uniref:bifunctional hydroxymethylpyrimidine kinase/phosphomethylpyrimidine kinase n=1 Tax=Mergibacter septicus TaxID=221402 RepID=UPI001C7883B4|nr:bifunctional hydroxymethylpyrimidine kinase/phosphomethylpyrimidine kinase [Mergibacter septicus]QDJ13234.1 bifunctional hydroxymethylpyrimidine kinase/phosphomethylpyrimidine kinase [Mergibacter septicus]
MKKAVLTIAGSDCSGGAGIQADLKTMTMNGVYAMSVITALTAQNTLGVTGILDVDANFLKKQLDAVFTDIYPEAVKIGMLSSQDLILTISSSLKEYKAKNIVVDPVMVSTSGSKLIADEAIETMCKELFPLAKVITPNIPEAEILSGIKIKNSEDMIQAAIKINKQYSCAVLCKGGHNLNDANDLLYDGENIKWFKGRKIKNPNTHGTGCTLSSAIAANLAKGQELDIAIEKAKEYISNALQQMLDLGQGRGPMDHGYLIKE